MQPTNPTTQIKETLQNANPDLTIEVNFSPEDLQPILDSNRDLYLLLSEAGEDKAWLDLSDAEELQESGISPISLTTPQGFTFYYGEDF